MVTVRALYEFAKASLAQCADDAAAFEADCLCEDILMINRTQRLIAPETMTFTLLIDMLPSSEILISAEISAEMFFFLHMLSKVRAILSETAFFIHSPPYSYALSEIFSDAVTAISLSAAIFPDKNGLTASTISIIEKRSLYSPLNFSSGRNPSAIENAIPRKHITAAADLSDSISKQLLIISPYSTTAHRAVVG